MARVIPDVLEVFGFPLASEIIAGPQGRDGMMGQRDGLQGGLKTKGSESLWSIWVQGPDPEEKEETRTRMQ